MIKPIKSSVMKSIKPERRLDSHKGDNGRVLIVGGSVDYYGAPLLSGLGALNGGADLVYLFVPECNFEVSRSIYPDFIVRKFPGEHLSKRYSEMIIEFARKCDVVLIGPGLSKEEKTLEAVKDILEEVNVPVVIDADAISVLKMIKKFPLQNEVVITPHKNEFANLVDREVVVKEDDKNSLVLLRTLSMDLKINVLLKGRKDFICSESGDIEVNESGNAGMTVGGSGDVLAGLVSAFVAQGASGYNAARCAAYYFGKCGELVYKHKGYYFAASDLAEALPAVLK